jgi:hypothetical protein
LIAPLLLAQGPLPVPMTGPDGPGEDPPPDAIQRPSFGRVTGTDGTEPESSVRQVRSLQDKDEPLPAKQPKPPQGGEDLSHLVELTPPAFQQLFRLESEKTFRDRLRDEARKRDPKEKVVFPDSAKTVPEPVVRIWPCYTMRVEPNYVCSKRLFFEQPFSERYGQSLGLLQPAISTGVFCVDTATWPLRWLIHPFQCWQCNGDRYSPYTQVLETHRWIGDR